jgi:hypothetical protein
VDVEFVCVGSCTAVVVCQTEREREREREPTQALDCRNNETNRQSGAWLPTDPTVSICAANRGPPRRVDVQSSKRWVVSKKKERKQSLPQQPTKRGKRHTFCCCPFVRVSKMLSFVASFSLFYCVAHPIIVTTHTHVQFCWGGGGGGGGGAPSPTAPPRSLPRSAARARRRRKNERPRRRRRRGGGGRGRARRGAPSVSFRSRPLARSPPPCAAAGLAVRRPRPEMTDVPNLLEKWAGPIWLGGEGAAGGVFGDSRLEQRARLLRFPSRLAAPRGALQTARPLDWFLARARR